MWNQTVINLFSIIGLLTSAYLLVHLFKAFYYYLKFKEFPKTIEEQTITILQSEKERLLKSISDLEEENKEITLMVLKRLE